MESAKGDNPHKDRKIAKIRSLGFEVGMIKWAENLNESEAYDLEESLIIKFGRKSSGGILTNICIDSRPPSALGRTVSDETREKIGVAQRGALNHRFGKTFTTEQKTKRSQIAKDIGQRPPVRSGPMSEEQKQKISEANKGRKWSEESRKRAREARRGVKRGPPSPETIEKIRQSNLGKKKRLRTDQEKAELSQKQVERWENMTDADRTSHREKLKAAWARRKNPTSPQ